MISRDELRAVLASRHALFHDTTWLLLLLELRDVLAEAMLVRVLVASDLTMTEFFDNLRDKDGER